MKKKCCAVILLRHAHRHTEKGRDLDNGLSKKGRHQAKRFTHFFVSHYQKTNPVIFSSPSKRCVQTVKPLAQLNKTRVVKLKALMEKGAIVRNESKKSFTRRIDAFCRRVSRRPFGVTIICSHGDWIPIALKRWTGKRLELRKGEWLELFLINGRFVRGDFRKRL